MLLKIVILIAAFCVANGSVITNSHEDESKTGQQGLEDTVSIESGQQVQVFDSDSEDTSARQKCDKNWCKKECNRIGYWIGICEKNKCRCYHKKFKTDASTGIEIPLPEELIIAEYPEVEEPNSVPSDLGNVEAFSTKSCVFPQCNQRCKSIGYRCGACRNKKCTCYKSKCPAFPIQPMIADQTETQEANDIVNEDNGIEGFQLDLDAMNTKSSCVFPQCNQRCKSMGYRCGACRNNKCTCYKNKCPAYPIQPMIADQTETEETNVIVIEDKEIQELQDRASKCNIFYCHYGCVNKGHKYGICKKNTDKCVCY